jgi:23S rRNA (cytidine2498-2'-O)-methyltransferase
MDSAEGITVLDHPTFLVSCAAGREGDAGRELRKALGAIEVRPLFLKGNLLLQTPNQEATEVLAALREARTQTVGRVVPVAVKAAVGAEADALQTLGQAALAAARFQPGDTFKVECRRRGDHAFSSQDVQRSVGMHLEAHTPASFRFTEPGYLVAVEIFQDAAWIGRVRPDEIVHKTITKMRIYAPGERPLNRAEKKLREALKAFDVSIGPGTRALDLGAAPGGWTKVMAEEGCDVLAVDPADLDPEVAALPNVTHFRGHSQEVPSLPDLGRLHLITNDMNLDPGESAQLLVPLIPLLKPTGAVIMTVKFMTPRREEHVRAALDVLAPLFEEHRHKHLPHNAKETTLFLSRPKSATW